MNHAMNLIAGEELTRCPTDGERTEWLGTGTDDTGEPFNKERCVMCGAIYHVYEDKEDGHE
jgi:hypothetical protein